MEDTINYLTKLFDNTDNIELEKKYFWLWGKELSKYSAFELGRIHELLLKVYGNLIVISLRNLKYMKLFYERYKEFPNIIEDYPNVPWYMHIIIVRRCNGIEDCLYFLKLVQKQNCNSCQLERIMERLNNQLPQNNVIIEGEDEI